MDEHTERRAEAAYDEFRRTRGPRAMAEVFDLTAGELLLFARRLARDAAAAEDLVQQTFVRAIERAEQFDGSRRLLPWLTAILANEARMVHRRGEPDVARVHVPEVVEPPQQAARRETQQAIDAAFAELPADYRDVVAMRHLHDMRPRHIAAALAIPVATVKTRLRRGVERLVASLPPGLAFATAISLLAGRGMAATRRAVLAHTGALAASTALASLGGVLTMKKLASVLGVALVLLTILPGWWNPEPLPVGAPSDAGAAPARAAAGGVDAVAPVGSLERTPAAEGAQTSSAAAEQTVAVDLSVHAVWKRSRAPAARVPLVLLVQPNDLLASLWTDHAGMARFTASVAARHWLENVRERSVSVATPLWPGAYFNGAVTSQPGTIEVELDDGQQVTGRVVDTAGNPVAGADVRLATSSYPEAVVARSDAAGAFELMGLPPDFALRASAGTMESAPATITDLARAGPLVLRLDRGGEVVQIRVTAGGQPVADATVRLSGWKRSAPGRQFVGSTDAEGATTFAGVPADTWVVEVVHRAHPPAQRRIATEGAGAGRVETVQLGEAATLVGIVRRGGRPAASRIMIAAADSLFYRADIGTDREGRFTADRLAVGTHGIWFADGASWDHRTVSLHAGEQTVEFDLPGGSDVVGRLLLPDGRPAPRWNVAVQRIDEMTGSSGVATDADGRFACENLPEGDYRLVATGPDGGRHTFFDVRTDGQAADYRLPATALWRPATIAGRFEDAPPDATLWISDGVGDGGSGVAIGEGGAIALGPLAPGRRRLWLEKDDAVLWLTEVELASGQALDLGVVPLPACGALDVVVRGGAGIDAAGAQVLLRSAAATGGGSFGPRPRVGADGAWHCERVPAGTWWLLVSGAGIAPDVRPIVLEAGNRRRIDVTLAPAVAVDFHLAVGAADEPLVGWRRETVRRVGDRAIVAFTQVVGSLHTRFDLARGSYTIDVETGGGFRGTVTFDVPAATPVEVPLARR